MLNFPALNLRQTTERQEGMEKGSVVLSGLEINQIINSAEIIINKSTKGLIKDTHRDYLEVNVSDKVVAIIQSYTDYINRKIWHK